MSWGTTLSEAASSAMLVNMACLGYGVARCGRARSTLNLDRHRPRYKHRLVACTLGSGVLAGAAHRVRP